MKVRTHWCIRLEALDVLPVPSICKPMHGHRTQAHAHTHTETYLYTCRDLGSKTRFHLFGKDPKHVKLGFVSLDSSLLE